MTKHLDTIIGVLVSTFFPKILEKIVKSSNKKIVVCLKFLIAVGAFLLYGLLDNLFIQIKWQTYINFSSNNFSKYALVLFLAIANLIAYTRDANEMCSFKKLSKKIVQFTSQVNENEILYIFCGDMDVWGDDPDKSAEFRQLVQLQEEHCNLDIRILCKHCMDDTLIDEISQGHIEIDSPPDTSRFDEKQVERIAFFKEKLKRCSFRFYRDPESDKSGLRARAIISDGVTKVLIYHRRPLSQIGRINNFFTHTSSDDGYIYEYNEFSTDDQYQRQHYAELCNLKWMKGCDDTLSEQIEEYCVKYVQFKNNKKSDVKRIAFVYAKTYEIAHYGKKRKEFPPFGVMYLAAAVRQNCLHWVPVIIPIEDGSIDIDVKAYDVIAFSVVSAYTVPIFEECMKATQKAIRTANANTICIAGGYQAVLEAERWLKSKYIKLVLRGEGENTIVQLLNSNYKSKTDYSKIPGAMFLSNRTYIEIPYSSAQNVDLSTLPMPARDLLPEDDYIMSDRLAGTKLKMVHVMFSRGCSYNCAYCGVPREDNRTVRYRPTKSIVDELKYLKNRGIEGFSIIDDCFLTNQEKALEIIEAVKEVGLKWSLAARIDQINETVVKALRNANCLEIKFGIETGSDKLLEAMDKGFTVAQAKAAIKLVRAHDIGVKAFIITGLPFEDDATNTETEVFLKEMGKDYINRVSLLRFVPLPGSHIYSHPSDYGIKRNISQNIDYRAFKLYDGETNWWENHEEFIKRNRIYQHIRDTMLSIWDAI